MYVASPELKQFFKKQTKLSSQNGKSLFLCPLSIQTPNLTVSELCQVAEKLVPKFPILYIKEMYEPTLDLTEFLAVLRLSLRFLKQSIVDWDIMLLYTETQTHISSHNRIPYPKRPHYYHVSDLTCAKDACLISPRGRQKMLNTTPLGCPLIFITPAINLLLPQRISASHVTTSRLLPFSWYLIFMLIF